jgi:hypothetical protein
MRNLLTKIVILFTIPVYIAVSCTERINITTDDAPPRIVIYGYITSDTTEHSIRITRSAGYFTTGSPEGVSNADVTLTDDDGKIIPFIENDTVAGLYQTAKDVYGEEGKTYTLNVLVNSEHYQSQSYLRHINHIDSIDLRLSKNFKQTVEVLLYAQDKIDEKSGSKNYYSIFVAINDSVVNSKINDYFVINNDFFRGQYIPGVECYFLNQNPDSEYHNEVLNINDKVTLNINAIPSEYATFIDDVKTEVRGSNPIFGGPPANVITNIQCLNCKDDVTVLGFFTAFPRRYAHTIVKEDFSVEK